MGMIPIDRQISAVKDELRKRKSLYPRWVSAGRMRQQEADTRIEEMSAVLQTLEGLRDAQRPSLPLD